MTVEVIAFVCSKSCFCSFGVFFFLPQHVFHFKKKAYEVFCDLFNLQLKDRMILQFVCRYRMYVWMDMDGKPDHGLGSTPLPFLLELCLSLYGLSFLLWVT